MSVTSVWCIPKKALRQIEVTPGTIIIRYISGAWYYTAHGHNLNF